MEELYKFYRKGGYECSSQGDRRFSAFYARLSDGRSIEEAYQLDVKGYRALGNNLMLGKGKEAYMHRVSYDKQWKEYKLLWIQWAKENKDLIDFLKEEASKYNYILSDRFASSYINQARALAEILNEDFSLDIKSLY